MALVSIDLHTGSIKKKEVIVGIDLGTTNSLVAVIDERTLEPKALSGLDKATIVPSVLYFAPNGEVITGANARQYLTADPENTIYSAKRLMGKTYNDLSGHSNFFSYKIINDDTENLVRVLLRGKYYTPIELSAYILKELKQRAETYLNAEVKKAVITVPAYFNDAQRQATRDAGKLAGLDVLRIVNEPTAASLAYGMGLAKNEEKTIAVYDLGGGTFDVSILKIHNGLFEVLATNGDTYLGGDDIDRAIVNHWTDKYQLAIDASNPAIRLVAEEAKKHLTANEVYKGVFEKRELELTLAELEKCIAPILQKTLTCCQNALSDSGLQLNEIEVVVMVGGSTRTPMIKKGIMAFFSHSSIQDSLNPDEVVALGAAIEADILAGNRKDMLLLDVTPLSLGIETMGGLMDVIIPRNNKIPARVGKQYTTSVDGQVNLKINVFQGERELVKENRKLAEFDLKGIPAMPAGFPKIEVDFLLNADGILKVKAKELRSGVEQEVEVKPQYGLTDQEVERMLKDSVENAEADVKTRMLLEARTEGQQLIYAVERFIDKNQSLLSDNELQTTLLLVNELKNELEGSEKNTILKVIDELNEYTRPFAERLMDSAISTALKGQKIE